MNYKISREALRDLENIWIFTFENWSKEQANRYVSLIIEEIEYLANYPDAGHNFGNIIEGYFRSRIKSHFNFYRKIRQADGIEVIRILH